ncbi:MAG: 3-methyl-2-oxobutanoate hydroxymethyltransferase [Paracoccus sp. (in: a-proteobacteria)]|uniref:3-methyl-2-oxobutanoate hydroxymethyltransferase n=1 Tax=Paracoccus sp. TaxID=267 RepID=UPI0039E3A1F5
MSATPERQTRLTPGAIRAMKGLAPIACLTAYTTPMAKLVDTHCDLILVGDSLGMVLHGLESTLGVTMEMMVLHGRAVARGVAHACLVVDMPFGSYEESPAQAMRNAARLMAETGCQAVKLEGGRHMAETVAFLTRRGIPVMGHVGLTPQSVHALGGYKVQGRGAAGGQVLEDARALAEAGAFSVVLEKLPASLGARISQEIAVPTVGIGAGAECDGQILVVDDMLGLFADFRPKFVRRFGELARDADAAIAAYACEVRARRFPGPEHEFADEGK